MCSHVWQQVHDLRVCGRCGLIRLPDGRFFFDRQLPNYLQKRKERKKRK